MWLQTGSRLINSELIEDFYIASSMTSKEWQWEIKVNTKKGMTFSIGRPFSIESEAIAELEKIVSKLNNEQGNKP